MTVRREYFARGSSMSDSFAKQHNQSANTHWRFNCIPHFKFDVDDKSTANNQTSVKLRITSVLVELAAPVIVYLPKQATSDVESHEDGHVKICRRVYQSDANAAAKTAAEDLIGKTFEGSGANIEAACQNALDHAAQDMGRKFRAKTLEKLDRLSAYYDQVAPQHPEAKYVDLCVEAAFKADAQLHAQNRVPANQ